MLRNFFRSLQSQGLPSRTVVIKLSTDFLNILLMGTDYLPVPRSSMRNTIAMLAQIHKYVKLCREVVAAHCWAVSWLCEHKCTNRGNKLTIFSRRRVEQCETFLAADAASCDPEAAIWSQQSPTWRRQSTHKSAKPPVTGCCKSTLNTTGNRWHQDANLRQGSSDRPA